VSEPISPPLAERGVSDVFVEDDFAAFVAARGPKLVRMARGLLRDPQHAEDVVQEVLVKAHQHWATICSRESPDAYVRRMLVNASTSFWRRAVRREFSVDSDAWVSLPGPDESARVDERDRILAALRRLSPKQRAVIVLRHYEGLSDEEIATVMGTSVGTVRSNIHRGLAHLRTLLTEGGSSHA
jgi:RNA polymerase sigma-70 factor (sigma-E family)